MDNWGIGWFPFDWTLPGYHVGPTTKANTSQSLYNLPKPLRTNDDTNTWPIIQLYQNTWIASIDRWLFKGLSERMDKILLKPSQTIWSFQPWNCSASSNETTMAKRSTKRVWPWIWQISSQKSCWNPWGNSHVASLWDLHRWAAQRHPHRQQGQGSYFRNFTEQLRRKGGSAFQSVTNLFWRQVQT